tara:strand:+ start:4365 stop:4844 length:480 start_codon:yes stop_codon:yes gene_type:complete
MVDDEKCSTSKKIHPCYYGLDFDESIDVRPYMIDYVEFATFIAKKSQMNHKHGCVIVHKGKVVSTGFNKPLKPGYSIHAEAVAIAKAKKMLSASDLKNCKLYVVRIGSDNMLNPLKYSRPCINCSKIIERSKIGKVFYSTSYDFSEGKCVPCDGGIKNT